MKRLRTALLGGLLLSAACADPLILAQNLADSEVDGSIVGASLRVAPTVVTASRYAGRRPTLLWLGDHYGLVWQDGMLITDGPGATPRPRYRTLDADGKPLFAAVDAAPSPHIFPAAVLAGDAIAMVSIRDDLESGQEHEVELRFLDTQGALLRGPFTVSAGPRRTPRIAWTGTSLGVTSSYSVSLGQLNVVSETGSITASAERITGHGDCVCTVDIAWSGSLFFVGYHNDGFVSPFKYDSIVNRYDIEGVETGSRFLAYPEGGAHNTTVVYGHGQAGVLLLHDLRGPIFSRFSHDGTYLGSKELEQVGPPAQYYATAALEVLPAGPTLPSGGFAAAYFLPRVEQPGQVAPATLRVVILDHQGQRTGEVDVVEDLATDWRGQFDVDLTWSGTELGLAFAAGLRDEGTAEIYFASIAL